MAKKIVVKKKFDGKGPAGKGKMDGSGKGVGKNQGAGKGLGKKAPGKKPFFLFKKKEDLKKKGGKKGNC